MKYAFIQSNRDRHRVSILCRVLRVSRSGFYDWCDRPPSARTQRDAELIDAIRCVHRSSRGSYGSDKTWRELRAQGEVCGRHRVARLRREAGIVAQRRKRFLAQRHHRRSQIVPNRLNQRFDQARRSDQIWAGDVTFIPTQAGWLYLAIVIDLCTRQIVGWAMSASQNRALVRTALEMAIERRDPRPGLLHHTDQGSVYASQEYQALLARHQIRPSMSRAGNCFDNAMAESFFSTLKNELIHENRFATREAARSAIFEYIEVFYNRQRLHQGLNYLTPLQADMSAR